MPEPRTTKEHLISIYGHIEGVKRDVKIFLKFLKHVNISVSSKILGIKNNVPVLFIYSLNICFCSSVGSDIS